MSVPDILTQVPRDLVRLYLALTAPEHTRTTFSRAGMDKVITRLVGSWNRLAGILGKAHANAGGTAAAWPPVSNAARARAATMLARFDLFYEMPTYSPSRAADTIMVHIDRLARRAAALDGSDINVDGEEWGDLFQEVKALIAAASPILIDLAEAAREAGAFGDACEPKRYSCDGELSAAAFDSPAVTPFTPPMLAGGR